MGKLKLGGFMVLSVILPILLLSDYVVQANVENKHYMPPLECYDPFHRPQVIQKQTLFSSSESTIWFIQLFP